MRQRVSTILAVALQMALIVAVICECCTASPSIRISPSRVEKQVRRFLFFEDRSIGPIRVTNNGTVPLKVRVSVEDLYQTEDGSAVFVTDGSYEYGAADLVTFQPVEFVVEPGKTQLVKGTVDTSSGRTGGGYCVVFFETQPSPGTETGMSTASRVGALLYIVFPGEAQVAGSIEQLEVSKSGDERVRVRVLLHNSGNIHICPRGVVRLKTLDAALVCSGTISPLNVLPEASRWLEGGLDLPSEFEPGEYLLETTVFLSDTKTAYRETVISFERSDLGEWEVSPLV
ncbi:MAG: hypothetical protein WBH35_02125 [Bacillota bacterium]|nr:hypothetical protein [Bacillota bacterium]